jgi:hypothetical protein
LLSCGTRTDVKAYAYAHHIIFFAVAVSTLLSGGILGVESSGQAGRPAERLPGAFTYPANGNGRGCA